MRPAADTVAVSADRSAAEARALVEARFPNLKIRTCVPILSGWDHVLLRVNGTWMFRIPRRRESEATLEREARFLPELAAVLPAAVPRFEYVSRSRASPRIFVGYRRIPGRAVSKQAVAGRGGAALRGDLARFLTALHGFPLDRALPLGLPIRDAAAWRREYAWTYRWVRREAFPHLRPRERTWTETLFEAFLGDASQFRFAPVLLHRDLVVEHILHDPRSRRLTGVVDWGDASAGDPAFDFTGLRMGLGETAARAILEAYRGPVDRGMMSRAAFYADITPFYAIIYGRQLGHPEWTREGLRRLRACVAGS